MRYDREREERIDKLIESSASTIDLDAEIKSHQSMWRTVLSEIASLKWDENRKVYDISDGFRTLCDELGGCLPLDE